MLMGGAHAAQFVRPPPCHQFLVIVFLIIILPLGGDSAQDDSSALLVERDALLKFKSSLSNVDPALSNWNGDNGNQNPCTGAGGGGGGGRWRGVQCFNGRVWGLQLEHMNLSGDINVDSLIPLPQLRSLSIMYNNFEGPLPEFRKLGALKSLFLSHNQFSGDIDDDAFAGMMSLKKVYMSDNMFSGPIPTSLASSPRLLELRMENNQFQGTIPDFPPSVIRFNASNNQLQGPIPISLQDIHPSAFAGNKGMCGPPTESACDSNSTQSPPPDQQARTENKTSALRIIAIVLACLIVLLAVIAALYHRSKSAGTGETDSMMASAAADSDNDKNNLIQVQAAGASTTPTTNNNNMNTSSSTTQSAAGGKKSSGGGADQHGKLSFIRDDRTRFDLQDLLRASAEVLGSGSFGSSYKAVLMDGQAVVVKRFKQMNNCGREEFHEHMRRLGRLAHPNLLPLVAYYYRKEEKLLVFEFVHNGSLARQLHGNHSVDKPGLDWPTRLNIVKGVAKGMAYLYAELPSLIVPHGHLKSSNVLLDKSMQPLLMDYALLPVVNLEQAQQFIVAYKSPEYAKIGRTAKKTDVWSLGILILETLTGKFPANYLAQGPGYGAADLESWVDSIAAESAQDVVFDKEMGNTDNAQAQMLRLLKLGLDCCQTDLEKRPELKEVAEKINLLNERDDQTSDTN